MAISMPVLFILNFPFSNDGVMIMTTAKSPIGQKKRVLNDNWGYPLGGSR
jgi:hypothetical protein